MFAVRTVEPLFAEDHAAHLALMAKLRLCQEAHQHRQIAKRHAVGVVAIGSRAIEPETAIEQVLSESRAAYPAKGV